MRKLIDKLNKATEAYELGAPIMTDKEWDNLYFKLCKMEQDTGEIYPDSPTQKIHYIQVSELKKVTHNHKMLSLDKTKDWNEFLHYFTNINCHKSVIGMVKLDGLTCSLRYLNGRLISAETRGNGIEGEDILHNAKVLKSIPKFIQYEEELVIDGEIICTYQDFKQFSDKYANPRNFASGSIRLLDSKECACRKLTFIAWNVVKGMTNSHLQNLVNLESLGFVVTPWTSSFDWDAKEFLIEQAKEFGYPIDGLVGRFDDIEFGASLGETSHHSRAAYAFKFYDDEYPTSLINIEYTMGRTGILTPVAIFDPIEIDGTVVERASLHNLSVMEELSEGFERKGDTLYIYKANQIIPQVQRWEHHGDYDEKLHIGLPQICPVCGGDLTIICDNNSKFLYCTNNNCEGKFVNKVDHFCGKKGLDIKGLSKNTLTKLFMFGWLEKISDIYELYNHREEWYQKPGFGVKSVDNILLAIEESKNTSLENFISALGIPLIGVSVAKNLTKYVSSYEEFREKIEQNFDFSQYYDFGENKNKSILNFDYTDADNIYNKYLTINKNISENKNDNNLEGINIVITGKLNNFKNRSELQKIIEDKGGKVISSVSAKTNYLINNDTTSNSVKNITAKKLGVEIISEEDFCRNFLIF